MRAGMSVYVCVFSWERINVLQETDQIQSLHQQRVPERGNKTQRKGE